MRCGVHLSRLGEGWLAAAARGGGSRRPALCFNRYEAAGEAHRLNPTKVAYLGNRAAAALKLRGLTHLRQACLDCKLATEIDPSYTKG